MRKYLESAVFDDISECYMKKISLYLLLFFVVLSLIGCGGRKTEDNSEISDNSGNDPAADADFSQDPETAADKDTGDNGDTGTDIDTETESDTRADGDKTADGDTSEDDEEISDSDETADEDGSGSGTVPAPEFVRQPEKMNIAPKDRTVTLICEAKSPCCEVKYQWYESPNGSKNSGTVLPGETEPAFETPVFTEKGIHYYYCTATAVSSSGESKTSASDVASVAYTALPTVYINTPDGVEITSKEEWLSGTAISVAGAGNESWNFDDIETNIRGRGNSTWNQPKKPYSLKLKKAREIMGMPKHKRWVLLANYLDDSFMKNEIAFYLSELFELDWTVHGEFADLVLNGEYQGLYWLGEAIKVDKNRVDINDGSEDMTDDEDKDYLVEMDIYYDEPVKFKSAIRQMPYMIKNDDYMIDGNDEITSGGEARLERFQTKINNLEKLLYPDFTEGMETNKCSAPDESYAEIIEIDSWAKFWFVNEIMNNKELGHPKSVFFTFDSANNTFKAGPVWDFDWTFAGSQQCRLKNTIYYNALFKSPAFVSRTKELWNIYSGRIDVETPFESAREKISTAAIYDALRWDKGNFNTAVNSLKRDVLERIGIVNTDIDNMSVPATN